MLRKGLSLLLLLAVLNTVPATSTVQSRRRRSPGQEPANQPTEQEAKMEREQAKRLNKDRQAALQRDTDRLLKLSTELKEYVDKTNENILSLDVIKKAEEIEKLAHSVKEKMKGY